MPTIKNVLDQFESLGRQTFFSGEADHEISSPKNIQEAEEHHISFIGIKFKNNFSEVVQASLSPLIIIDERLIPDPNQLNEFNHKSFILSPNPKADLIEYCQIFLGFQAKNNQSQIHPSAQISSSATIGKNVRIAAGVIIEENVFIGDQSSIDANSVIKENTIIGSNVEIGACNVIGGTGFGYSIPEGGSEYVQFPHYGKVIIKDRVHIGNNTCIDRGSLSDTVLEEAVKVDNLVHIAHNVKIGENSLIIACSMIAGSVEIGKDCWVAPSSTVRNGISIGDRVTVGLASTVTKSISNDLIVTGSPAIKLEDFKKVRAHQKKIIEQANNDSVS